MNTTTDLFEHAYQLRVNGVRSRYVEALNKFLLRAEANPTDAVKWCEDVLALQHELRVLEHAWKTTKTDAFATRRNAILHEIEVWRRCIVLYATGGRSTSELTNGVEQCRIVGIQQAIEKLEVLADHEEIDS